jgi:hypothetical protein
MVYASYFGGDAGIQAYYWVFGFHLLYVGRGFCVWFGNVRYPVTSADIHQVLYSGYYTVNFNGKSGSFDSSSI